MELTGIIERLECIRRLINGAFTNGKISFDAITFELEAIINDLQTASLTSSSKISIQPFLKAKEVTLSSKTIAVSDYK